MASVFFTRAFRLRVAFGAIIAAMSACVPASAQTLTWDANGSGAGVTDGGGAWLSGTTWWNGTTAGAWTAGADAVFGNGGTGGAVTLSGTTSANSITFNPFTGTYTLGTAGQTLTIGGGGITMNSGAGAVTFSSPITLGTAQSWTNNSSSLLTVSGNVANGGNRLTIAGSGNATVGGVISGAGGLTKTGNGRLTLSSSNTYSGGTQIDGGAITGSVVGALGTGTIAIGSSGTATLLGRGLSTRFTNAVTGSGNLVLASGTGSGGAGSNSTSFTGDLSGFSGTVTLTSLSSAGDYIGIGTGMTGSNTRFVLSGTWGTAMSAPGGGLIPSLSGTLALGELSGIAGSQITTQYATNATYQIGALSTSSTYAGAFSSNNPTGTNGFITLQKVGSGTLTLTGTSAGLNGISIWGGAVRLGNGGAGGVINDVAISGSAGGRLVFDRSTPLTYASAISGGIGLVVNSGSLTLSASNSYTGGTQINAGATISASTATSLGTGTVSIASSGTLRNPGNGGNLPLANTITGSGVVILFGTSGYATVSGNLSGFTGTFQVDTTNNYAGVSGDAAMSGSNAKWVVNANNANFYTYTASGSGAFGELSGNGYLGGSYNTNTLWRIGDLSTSSTFSGVIRNNIGTGNTSINKVGTGLLALSGSNINTGTMTVSGGVLLLNSGSAINGGIGSTGGLSAIVLNGGVLGLGAGNFSRGLGTGNSQVNLTNGGGFAAYGSDRTVNLGSGTAAVTWGSGNFVASGSTFVLGAASATHTVDFQNPIALGSAGNNRTIQVGDGSAAVDATLSGTLSGAANLVKTGAGTLRLSAANTYTGATTITSGTLLTGIANAISGSSAITIGSAGSRGALEIDHALTISNLTFTGLGGEISAASTGTVAFFSTTGTATINVLSGSNAFHAAATLSSPTLVDVADGAFFSFHNNLAGSASLTKAGLGTMELSGDNDGFAGNFFITAGHVDIGSGMNQAGSGTTTISGGATLDLNGHSLTNTITVLSGTIINQGNASATTNIDGPTTISGSNAGIYNVNSGGIGTFTGVLGASATTDVNINSGGQGIFNADIESLADVVVNTGGEATFAAAVNGAIYTHESSTVRFDSTGTQTVAGLINGPAAIVKQGSGVLLLTAANTGFSGGLTITSGTVRAGNANALGTGGPLALNTGGLDLNGNAVAIGLLTGSAGSTVTSSVAGPASLISNATGDSTFAGVISNGAGTVSFEKAGGGTLTFTGVQTYTGDTIISGGGLALDSGASLASTSIKVGETLGGAFLDVTALGNFAVASGQTLGGHGDVIGDVTIANGAILSPGGSVGLLYNEGDMTWGGGGQFLFEIFNAEGGPASDWDWLNVTGNLNITSSPETPFVINLQTLADPNDSTAGLMPEGNWNDTTDYAWRFVTTGTTISPFNTNLFAVNTTNFQNPYGGTFSVKRGDQAGVGTDSELYIVYAAIPEPGTLVLAAIGLAAAGWHLRRRK